MKFVRQIGHKALDNNSEDPIAISFIDIYV